MALYRHAANCESVLSFAARDPCLFARKLPTPPPPHHPRSPLPHSSPRVLFLCVSSTWEFEEPLICPAGGTAPAPFPLPHARAGPPGKRFPACFVQVESLDSLSRPPCRIASRGFGNAPRPRGGYPAAKACTYQNRPRIRLLSLTPASIAPTARSPAQIFFFFFFFFFLFFFVCFVWVAPLAAPSPAGGWPRYVL